MSLNRFEQTIFDYWSKQPEELRHWQAKTVAAARNRTGPEAARSLERELWDYFCERTEQVSVFRQIAGRNPGRLSLLNLAEYMIRLWGPLPKTKSGHASHSVDFG